MFCKTGIGRRMGKIAVSAVFLIFLSGFYLGAQEDRELPGWVLHEKARIFYDEGNLSKALEYFSLSGRGGALTPEALYGTGLAYQAEGDYLLAEERFKEALKEARFFYVPDEKWNIYYSLAEIYRNTRQWDLYEQTLLQVFDNEVKRNTEIIRQEHQYVQILKADGLDKLLLLYRLKLSYALKASERLGWFYNRQHYWKSSLVKNLYPVFTLFSRGMELLLLENPSFSFPRSMDEAWKDESGFLISLYESYCKDLGFSFRFSRNLQTLMPDNLVKDRAQAEALIRERMPGFKMSPASFVLSRLEALEALSFEDFLSLYEGLFFLGEALYQEGNTDRALDLWQLLLQSRRDSDWKKLAAVKMQNPDFKTPFLRE